MELKFFSIDEVKDFVKQLKGTRGGKNDADDEPKGQAPVPLQPPQGQPNAGFAPGAAGFAPPAGGAGQTAAGPFAAGAQGPAPEVVALVNRINVRMDGAIASGQPAEAARAWLAGQCGPDCSGCTMDQLKTVALPRLSLPALENIAKLMAA